MELSIDGAAIQLRGVLEERPVLADGNLLFRQKKHRAHLVAFLLEQLIPLSRALCIPLLGLLAPEPVILLHLSLQLHGIVVVVITIVDLEDGLLHFVVEGAPVLPHALLGVLRAQSSDTPAEPGVFRSSGSPSATRGYSPPLRLQASWSHRRHCANANLKWISENKNSLFKEVK